MQIAACSEPLTNPEVRFWQCAHHEHHPFLEGDRLAVDKGFDTVNTPLITERAAKAKARVLRIALGELGMPLKQAQALEVIARLEGENDWQTLNAKQVRALAASVSKPSYVGEENLLTGHVLVDDSPVSSFGGSRKTALYDAMRVIGVPYIYHHPIVEAFQEHGGFSAPAPKDRRKLPDNDTKYDDDAQPCNVQGMTRAQVFERALECVELPDEYWDRLTDEFRARSGFMAPFVRPHARQ